MNDYEMNFLASDRRQQLSAEARQHRAVKGSKPADRHAKPSTPRRGLRFGLGHLVGRTAA